MADNDKTNPPGPTSTNVDVEIKINDLISNRRKIYELNEQSLKNSLLTSEQLAGELKSQNEAYEEQKKLVENIDTYSKNLVDSEQIITEAKENQLKTLKEQFLTNQKTIVLLLQKQKLIDEEVKNGKKTQEQAEKEKNEIDKRLKLLKEQTIEQGKQIQQGEREKKLKEDIKSIGNEILQQTLQYGQQLEKHIMNISKLNGGYAEHGSKLREANLQIYQATAGTGIMFEEANAAFAGLSQNFIGLTTQSQDSISKMVEGTAQLTKLGVDAGSASKGFDSLVNAMGKTPLQAHKIQESFVQMAAKNRLALGAVSQAFAENSSRFVGYGEQMTKVLDGLAEQSLKTGIAIGKLVGIAQGFDTFEDASRKVGNLNALLGGDYFNSIEMLTASDEERIKLLKEGVLNSGIQWESMNRFQKMAIANAAGINDLNEASKMFGKTSLENTKQQEEAAKVQKTLAEQAESVSTSMDKMKSVLNGVIIALDPLVSLVGTIVEILVLPAKIGASLGQVGAAVGSIISLIGILAIKNLILKRSFMGVGSSIGGAIKKMFGWITAKETANKVPVAGIQKTTSSQLMSSAAPTPAAAAPAGPGRFTSFVNNINPVNLIAAAGALLILAAALFVMAKALQEFAKVAGDPNADGAAKLAAGSLLALVIAAKLIKAAGTDVLIGSLIILAMAASVLVLGIALQKFNGIDWKLVAGVGLIILGLGLAIAGLGMALSGPQALTLAIGIGVIVTIAAALSLMGLALKSIVDAIANASPALSNLANSFKQLFEIKDLKDNFSSIESFLSQLSDIDYDPISELANAIGLLATNMERLSSISSIMNIKGSAEMSTVQNIKSTAEEIGKTANTIGTSTAAQQSLIPVQQTTAFVPLLVQVDKKTIIEILEKDIKSMAYGEALNALDAVGIVQSAFEVQNRRYGGT